MSDERWIPTFIQDPLDTSHCTGAADCPSAVHVHGCYHDTPCTHPAAVAATKIEALYARTQGEDVPGVLHWVWFDGGHLDGQVRPIALLGRAAIVDGSTYTVVVPSEQEWSYSAERDRYELVTGVTAADWDDARSVNGTGDVIERDSDSIKALDVPDRDPATGQWVPPGGAHWANQSVHARYPNGTDPLAAIKDAMRVFMERTDGSNALGEPDRRTGPVLPEWYDPKLVCDCSDAQLRIGAFDPDCKFHRQILESPPPGTLP